MIHERCNSCHNGDPPSTPPDNGAPFPLLSFQDVLFLYGTTPVWQDMERVIQPASVPHMPFGAAPQLTCDQKKILDDWLNACAPPAAAGMGCGCPKGWKPADGDKGTGCTKL